MPLIHTIRGTIVDETKLSVERIFDIMVGDLVVVPVIAVVVIESDDTEAEVMPSITLADYKNAGIVSK